MPRRKTTDEFIKEARDVHGNKYNYDKVAYVNNKTSVAIICPIHGDFPQIAGNHLDGQGCPYCARETKTVTMEEFITKARAVHGNKYNYDKTEYVNDYTPVLITCMKHGDFPMTPNHHKAGCDKIWTSKYQDYLDLREWARDNKFTCPNEMVIDPSELFYRNFNEDDFDGDEIAIMFSPCELDYFLIKYCPLQFVQDYLKSVYSEKHIQSVLNGTSPYDRFVPLKPGSKVKLIYREQRSNRLSKFRHHKQKFDVSVTYNDNGFWCNEDYDKWFISYDKETDTSELGLWTGHFANVCHTIRALVRKIRKWKLPKGSIVEAFRAYEGETYKFVVR